MSRRDRMLKAIQNSDGKFWDVRAVTTETGGKAGELYIYGYIWGEAYFEDEVSPMNIKKAIDALGDIETLYVRINSPGGNVWAGNAIYNILRRVDAEVIGTIDGLAASAASVIAMGCDKLIVYRNSTGMIHDAWTVAIGNARELRKTADVLDKIQEALIGVYEEKTGLPRDEIKALLEKETWLTADEMVKKGFADEVDGTKEVKASLQGDKLVVNGQEFDASIFGVLPPFEGVAAAEDGSREGRERPNTGLRRAFGVIAKALGFDDEPRGGIVPEEPEALLSEEQAEAAAQAVLEDLSNAADQSPETKGSAEQMSETKTPQAVQEPAPQATPAPVADIKNMDPEAIAARLADLEARAKAAEDLAKAERDKRLEAEFVDRVEGYGALPVAAAEFGPVMKRASEALAQEDFDKIEAVLKAAGEALAQSDLFKSLGRDGEGDTSAAGQYRAALKAVMAEKPDLSEAEASLEAFDRLPEAVQKQVFNLNILPA